MNCKCVESKVAKQISIKNVKKLPQLLLFVLVIGMFFQCMCSEDMHDNSKSNRMESSKINTKTLGNDQIKPIINLDEVQSSSKDWKTRLLEMTRKASQAKGLSGIHHREVDLYCHTCLRRQVIEVSDQLMGQEVPDLQMKYKVIKGHIKHRISKRDTEHHTMQEIPERHIEREIPDRHEEQEIQERNTEQEISERHEEREIQEHHTEQEISERHEEQEIQEHHTEQEISERHEEREIQEHHTEQETLESHKEQEISENHTEQKIPERHEEIKEHDEKQETSERNTEQETPEHHTEKGVSEHDAEEEIQELHTEQEIPERQAAQDIPEKQMEKENYGVVDESLSFTCKNRCGDTAVIVPCSCSPICVLYNTCCENITLDCPGVVQEGHTIFSPYIGEKVRCEKWKVFNVLSSPCLNTSYPFLSSDIIGHGLSLTEIQQYIDDPPVTDKETGITYRTRSVYECYKTLLNLTSDILTWGLELDYKDGFSYEESVSNEVTASIYKPDFDAAILTKHTCKLGVIDSCDLTYVADHHDTQAQYFFRRCNEFTGLVRSTNIISFRNRFCAYCQGTMNGPLSLETRPSFVRGGSKLSVVITQPDDDSYKLQIDAALTSIAFLRSQPWSTVKCPSLKFVFPLKEIKEKNSGEADITQNTLTDVEEAHSCKATACGDQAYILEPDGICRGQYHMIIGFKVSGQGLPPLTCKTDANIVADFIVCSLELLFKDEPWTNSGRFSKQDVLMASEVNTKEIFYFVEVRFYSAYHPRYFQPFALARDDFISNVEKLTAAVRVYITSNASKEICPPQELADGYTDTEFEITDTIPRERNGQMYVRGTLTDTENAIIVVCYSTISVNPAVFGSGSEHCSQVEYPKDEALVDKILGSTCPGHLSLRSQSDQLRPTDLFTIYAMYLLFVYRN